MTSDHDYSISTTMHLFSKMLSPPLKTGIYVDRYVEIALLEPVAFDPVHFCCLIREEDWKPLTDVDIKLENLLVSFGLDGHEIISAEELSDHPMPVVLAKTDDEVGQPGSFWVFVIQRKPKMQMFSPRLKKELDIDVAREIREINRSLERISLFLSELLPKNDYYDLASPPP